MWNSLPITVRQIENLNLFRKIINVTKDVPKVPKCYCLGERKYSVYHTRIRNKCSNLNVDLYYNHLSQTEACDCGKMSETPQHFFFECKNYITERSDMLRNLFSNSLPVDLNSLIYGNDTLTDAQNEIIFGIVQHFIKETKRFVWSYFIAIFTIRQMRVPHIFKPMTPPPSLQYTTSIPYKFLTMYCFVNLFFILSLSMCEYWWWSVMPVRCRDSVYYMNWYWINLSKY